MPCSSTRAKNVATKRKCFKFCFIVSPSEYKDFLFSKHGTISPGLFLSFHMHFGAIHGIFYIKD